MSLQRLYQRKGLVMLSWLTLSICLISASSIHHHDSGIHLPHACQLCLLEKVTTHGSAVSTSITHVVEQAALPLADTMHPITSGVLYFTRDIRGSPLFS